MRHSLLTAALVAVFVAVLAAGGFLWATRPDDRPTNLTPLSVVGAAEAQTAGKAVGETTPAEVQDMVLGSEDAPLTVIEYASFTCPHCRTWHDTVWSDFKANYIDAGKVRFVYREVYFDRFGLWAALVARCGGPMKYFGIVDMLYDTQREWLGDGQDDVVAANLTRIGLKAGMSADKVDACIKDGAKAAAMVSAYQANATADGVEATPTFFIGGEKVAGAISYADFTRIVDARLGG
ncbi:MAG: DsbA family protein [Pseudomonadota bacterium]